MPVQSWHQVEQNSNPKEPLCDPVVQSFSHVQLLTTPWTETCQASLSFTSQSLLKLLSIELVMPFKTISTSVATRPLYDLWKFLNQLELLFSHSQNGKQWYPSGPSQETRNHTSHLRSENLIWKKHLRTSLVVKWLRFHISSIEAVGSIPGLGTKIPHATWQGQSKQTNKQKLVAQTVKHLSAMLETRVWSLGWEDPLGRKWQPTPVLLPGKSHGQRSLVGYSHGVAKSQTRLSDFPFTFVN